MVSLSLADDLKMKIRNLRLESDVIQKMVKQLFKSAIKSSCLRVM